jgi:flagellar basal-body rod protein FlgG
MTTALQIARSGLDALDQRMKTISNNLANVSTTGFKRDRANFASLMYQDDRSPGAASGADSQYASGLGTGTGVRVVGTERIHAQGTMIQTDNALDLAVDGAGFFAVQMPDGTVGYTRDGGFKLSAMGEIVTTAGLRLAQPLTVPDGATQLVIAPDGTVTASLPGQAVPVEVGQLQLARFLNPAGLMPVGDNLYRETAGSGPPTQGVAGQAGMGQVRQGMLEGSNVSTVQELVDMIETQRAYEINSKVISADDEMSRYVVQNV